MKRVENLNAPSLSGFLIAAAMGLIAFAVAKVIGGFDYTTSGFFGLLVFIGAALFLVIPWGARERIPTAAGDASHAPAPVAEAAPAAAKVSAGAKAAYAAVAPVAAASAAAAPAAAAKPAKAEKAAAGDVAVMEAPAKAAKPAKAPAAAKAEAAAAKPAAKTAAKASAKAEAAAPAVGEGTKPKALKAPRKGQADDLKQIEGIGPALEKLCNELGIYHFDQIAGWGVDEVAWMDTNLKGFKGRVSRDRWVAQAKLIGEVGMEEFLRRAKTNDY